MISNDMIKGEIEFYEDMQRSLSVKQRGLPKGNIYFKQEHGRKRPYVRIDGKEKYLSTQDIKTIRGLMSRAEIERALKLIGQNMLLLEGMQGNFVDFSEIIHETYAFPDTGLSKYKISKISDQWAEQRRTDRLPAELFVGESLNYEDGRRPRQFRTSDGSYVKSKSELVIYEYLKLKGVPFIYERPCEVNGQTRYPDFTIIRETDGQMILWEHFGMMEHEWYRDNAQKKLWDYAEEGFWPFKNLITTFEFGDGDLDIMEIGRILKMMQVI